MNNTKDKGRDGDALAEALCSLTCAISELREQRKTEFEWFKAHMVLATRADLRETERRIIEAIRKGDSGSISKEDEAALAGLLARQETIVAKLEALDAKTPAV